MESRILYLEKELSLLRKKISILEDNIQNDMKNYVDHYMKVYLEQLDINVQKADEQVNPARKQEKRKLKEMKTEGKTISPKILGTRCEEEDDIKLKNNLIKKEEEQDFQDNVLKNEFENGNTWSETLQDNDNRNLEYIIVEGDEEHGIVLEVKEEEILDQTGEYSEEFEEYSDAYQEDEKDYFNDSITVTEVTSLSNTPNSIPRILSKARDIATVQAQVAVSLPSTHSSSNSSLTKESPRFPFRCPICQEVFKCASHFGKHKIKHISDRPFKCEHCDKAYKRSHHLKEHQTLSHPTENHKVLESGRGFRCAKCQKVFSRPSLLAAHEKTHSKGDVAKNKAGDGKNTNILTPQFHGFTLNL